MVDLIINMLIRTNNKTKQIETFQDSLQRHSGILQNVGWAWSVIVPALGISCFCHY